MELPPSAFSFAAGSPFDHYSQRKLLSTVLPPVLPPTRMKARMARELKRLGGHEVLAERLRRPSVVSCRPAKK